MPLFPDAASVPTSLTTLVGDLARAGSPIQVRDGERTFTFAEIAADAERLAAGLARWGVGEGDHVAISMANRVEWLHVWFAVARIGAVLVPLNTRFTEPEVGYVLRQGDVTHLIWEDGTGSLGAEAIGRLTAGEGVHLRGCAVLDGTPVAGAVALTDLYDEDTVPVREDGRALGMIQYTSGSTGFPKGAMLTNAGLVRNGWGLGRAWQMTEHDVVLVANPLFHCGGSVFSFMAAVTSGAATVLMRGWQLGAGLETMRAHAVTVAPVIDAAARDLVLHAESTGETVSSLRLLSTAADADLFTRVARSLGCEVSNVFGLTECSPNVCVGDLADPIQERIDHIGRPQEGLTVDIRDPDSGRPVSLGDIGEIVVQGEHSVMLGYYQNPDATARAFTADGFLRTGDLGRLCPDGRLDYCGRAKLMIKSGGENISIEEVESALRAHAAVADVIVAPVPHERFAEVGLAFLQPAAGATLDPDEVLAWIRGTLAGFKIPKYAVVIDTFPRSGSGKVDRASLTARAKDIVGTPS
ncbi:class I adenylate-forming enzyme family protein [Nocardioides sp. LHD-245]|uniref:class I adenylate-forming enzyme family protein n=1 Tax=Nocardioides sp. LHD-245 TaxID=3051387 RepID=UPI0027E19FBB|nr:class I adenylate-forming enzyme family protein [Nocardioides sp. LHD-245]